MADSAPGPTDDEIFIRAQEIFGAEYGCWPSCAPSRVAAEAELAYEEGKLCRLDYYAITTTLLLLVSTSPPDHVNKWPPRTPAELAKKLDIVRDVTWPQIVKVTRKGDKRLRTH